MLTIQKILKSYNDIRTQRIKKENFKVFLDFTCLQDFYLNPSKLISTTKASVSIIDNSLVTRGSFLVIGAIHPGSDYLLSIVDSEVCPLVAIIKYTDFEMNNKFQEAVEKFQKRKDFTFGQKLVNDIVHSDEFAQAGINIYCAHVQDCMIESNLNPLNIND